MRALDTTSRPLHLVLRCIGRLHQRAPSLLLLLLTLPRSRIVFRHGVLVSRDRLRRRGGLGRSLGRHALVDRCRFVPLVARFVGRVAVRRIRLGPRRFGRRGGLREHIRISRHVRPTHQREGPCRRHGQQQRGDADPEPPSRQPPAGGGGIPIGRPQRRTQAVVAGHRYRRVRIEVGGVRRQRARFLPLRYDPLQVRDDGAEIRISPIHLFFETPREDPLDWTGRTRVLQLDGVGLLMENLVHERGDVLSLKRHAPHQELIKQHPKGEDVRSVIDLGSFDLLGRHVPRRADARLRQRLRSRVQAGDAEIHDLHTAAIQESDVFRLDVAVNDAVLVGVLKPLADRQGDLEFLVDR